MAKYNWTVIENAYIQGVEIEVICKEYKVAKKTLQNRIYSKKLDVNRANINTSISEVGQVLGNISGNAQNDPILKEIILEKLDTMLQDNEITGNNRKLTKAFQNLVGKGIKDGIYKTPQDIKAGASTIKDFEAISNPNVNQSNINIDNQNNQALVVEIE